MLRTYDIDDDDMETIKGACSHIRPESLRDSILSRLESTCDAGERIVTSAQAFREKYEGSGFEDDEKALAEADDDLINTFLGDEFVYNAWHQTCEEAMLNLKQHLALNRMGQR